MTRIHSPRALRWVVGLATVSALACNLPGLVSPQAGPIPPPTAQQPAAPTATGEAQPTAPPAEPTQAVASEVPPSPSPVTPAPTFTSTPSATSTPVAILLTNPHVSTTSLFKGPGGCTPDSINFKITVSDPSRIKNVILFWRMQDKASAAKTDWNDGVAMTPMSGGVYSKTISSAEISSYPGFGLAWLYYQFVATDRQNNFIRSPVYTDVTITYCP